MGGTLIGYFTRKPVGMGRCVAGSLVQAKKGEDRPKAIDTGLYRHASADMTDARLVAVLYD